MYNAEYNKVTVNVVDTADSAKETQYDRQKRCGHTYANAKANYVPPTFTEEELATEVWTDVPSILTGGLKVEASSLGRVRKAKTKYIYSPQINFCGALIVNARVPDENTNSRMIQVSKVVFYAWNPHLLDILIDADLDIDHIDSDKTNNRPGNLRLIPHIRNARRAREPIQIGETIYPGKNAVAESYGVTPRTVDYWVQRGRANDGSEIKVRTDLKSSDGLVCRL